MPSDLTAILLPKGQRSDEEIRQLVRARDVILRIAPLDAVGLVQVEVCDARRGLPMEDPDLVARLAGSGRAAFVHVNHSAKQALVHGFADGTAKEGWAGAPGEELESKLRDALGVGLDAILAADDGSRFGIGVSSSRTVAFVRGRELALPPGTPTGLDSFHFHDRGQGLDDGERLALFAFDAAAVRARFGAPGRELAAQIQAAPAGLFGPLEGARVEVVEGLAALGDRAPGPGDAVAVRALELTTLGAALVFAGGDAARYWDHRVLPMFSLSDTDPVFAADELEDLEESASVLDAMVEVLPYAAPPGGEGAVVASLGDDELQPLAPWARPGEEYAGSILRVSPARLTPLVRGFTGQRLSERLGAFVRAWYRAARPGLPEGDALAAWERAKAEEGRPDVERFLGDWTELRALLELGEANRLELALLFYEGA